MDYSSCELPNGNQGYFWDTIIHTYMSNLLLFLGFFSESWEDWFSGVCAPTLSSYWLRGQQSTSDQTPYYDFDKYFPSKLISISHPPSTHFQGCHVSGGNNQRVTRRHKSLAAAGFQKDGQLANMQNPTPDPWQANTLYWCFGKDWEMCGICNPPESLNWKSGRVGSTHCRWNGWIGSSVRENSYSRKKLGSFQALCAHRRDNP